MNNLKMFKKIKKGKFNKSSARFAFVKAIALKPIIHHWKKVKKIYVNEKICHIHELEDLILLEYHYSQIVYIDSTQSLMKFQLTFC